MLTEDVNTPRTDLLITQQQNTGISGEELASLRRILRLAKRIIGVTERKLHSATLKVDDLN